MNQFFCQNLDITGLTRGQSLNLDRQNMPCIFGKGKYSCVGTSGLAIYIWKTKITACSCQLARLGLEALLLVLMGMLLA